ncbi:hypothetical protein [Flavobacterium sp.]|uniref:hypothetical protein n=1 Tax=Flavobacterium sp. TaxID=239 RepID=UPI00374DD4A8
MRTDYINYEEPISTDDTPLYVEQYERDHMDWQYKSTREQLLCWGEESNYLDSEFSNELENTDQGNLDDTDYDDALDEDPTEEEDEEDDDPYEDFEEDETDEEDFEKEDLDDEDLNDEDLE